jgi:hypothetical protein
MPPDRDRNDSGQYADGIEPETVLAVVDDREDLARPVTAGDVVDELGIARRTAHNKLGRLVERGTLDTMKIGAKARVYWRPLPADEIDSYPPAADAGDSDAFDTDDLEGNPENTLDDEMTDGGTQQPRDGRDSGETPSGQQADESVGPNAEPTSTAENDGTTGGDADGDGWAFSE